MGRLSPDESWRDPRFALRRLLRCTTIDRGQFAPVMQAGMAAAIGERVARGQRAALAAGGRAKPARVALLLSPVPRSGSNFLETLISAHDDVAAAPCGMREAAFLAEADRIRGFETGLARRHADNAALFGDYEFLGHAVSGFLGRAAAESPEARVILLKDPHARRLELIPAILPGALTALVLRDGRRTLDSMLRTWPPRLLGRSFADMCLEWALATEAALIHAARAPTRNTLLLRYEDAAADPLAVATRIWSALGLKDSAAAARAARAAPVIGSSTHSGGAGAVDWRPRPAAADFNPAGREVQWPRWRERVFARVAGAVQARLDREAPIGAPQPRASDDGPQPGALIAADETAPQRKQIAAAG